MCCDNKVIKVLIQIALILNIILGIFIIYEFTILNYCKIEKLEYIECTDEECEQLKNFGRTSFYQMSYEKLEREQIKELVKKVVDPKIYFEGVNSDISCRGKVYTPIRLVLISNKVQEYEYCYVLTHEFVHLAYLIADERLTDYLTIKLLYESGIDYLIKTAYYAIDDKLSWRPESKEYDCTAYLIEYFKDRL